MNLSLHRRVRYLNSVQVGLVQPGKPNLTGLRQQTMAWCVVCVANSLGACKNAFQERQHGSMYRVKLSEDPL